MLLSLLSLAMLTQAQSTQPSCFTLTGSTACAPYSEMQVQSLADVFTDVASFDLYMNSIKDNNASYIADFQTRYACPSYAGLGQRYHLSTFCGLFVNAATSNGCNNNTIETVQMCPLSIAAAIQSLNVLYNSTTCTQTPNQAARSNFLTGYTNYQQRLSNTSTTCLSGFQSEISQCGFFTLAEGIAYCVTNSADPCCLPSVFQNATAPIMVQNLSNLGNLASPATSSSSNGVVIGAAIAGSIVLLIIIAAVIYYIRNRQSSTSKDQSFSNGDPIQIAETYEVIYNYVPNLSDEVYLYVGDKIIVKCKFDDGWCLGYNLSTKQEGSFPMACVSTLSTTDARSTYKPENMMSNDESSIRQRGSSLYVPKN